MEDRMHRSFRNRGPAIIGASIMLLLAACGDDDDVPFEDTDIDVNASAGGSGAITTVDGPTAQLALSELTSSVDANVILFGSNAPGAGAAPSAAAPNAGPQPASALSFPCTAGGTANVDGYVNVNPSPVVVDVKVMIAYAACVTASGTSIAGNVDFSQTVVAGPGAPLRIETLYQGDVVLSGNVNARCPIDLNVLVDETGSAVQVAGTFCGQDASTLNLRVSPHWSSAS
jgi:hypothetical protein